MTDTADRIAALERELAETAAALAAAKADQLPSDWWTFLRLPADAQDRHRQRDPAAVKALERRHYAGIAAGRGTR